jgi:hypothetical protein
LSHLAASDIPLAHSLPESPHRPEWGIKAPTLRAGRLKLGIGRAMQKNRERTERRNQIPNPKSQISNNFQMPKNKWPKELWNFEFLGLEFIWDLVLVIWCLS